MKDKPIMAEIPLEQLSEEAFEAKEQLLRKEQDRLSLERKRRTEIKKKKEREEREQRLAPLFSLESKAFLAMITAFGIEHIKDGCSDDRTYNSHCERGDDYPQCPRCYLVEKHRCEDASEIVLGASLSIYT